MLSGRQLKLLGKRLRDGTATVQDIRDLEIYRDGFDSAILSASLAVQEALSATKCRAVLAGRLKRLKSIRRKLARPANQGMDLSRMADIAGLRIILSDLRSQDEVAALLTKDVRCKDVRDSRETGRDYRAIHIIWKEPHGPVEIQVRSLPQHLWATESESFGEAVKEGGGNTDIRDYLRELSKICAKIDHGKYSNAPEQRHPMMQLRAPISARLRRLEELFHQASSEMRYGDARQTSLVVYDNELESLQHVFNYRPAERHDALRRYRELSQRLGDDRHEVLLLNSARPQALTVTHPRFFPEGET